MPAGPVATTNAMRSNVPATGSVRPDVIAYGRTTGPASPSNQRLSSRSCCDAIGPLAQAWLGVATRTGVVRQWPARVASIAIS